MKQSKVIVFTLCLILLISFSSAFNWSKATYYYDMDSTTISDVTGNSWNGTNGGTATTSGKHNDALDFTPNDYIQFPDLGWTTWDTNWTLNLWLNPDDITRNNAIMFPHGDANMNIDLNQFNTGFLTFRMKQGSDYVITTGRGNISESDWNMLTFRYILGDGMYTFINGTQLGYLANAGGVDAYSAWNNYLGRYPNTVNYFDGKMDEVMFFNSSLEDSEITELWNNEDGLFWDEGGSSNPPTVELNTPVNNTQQTSQSFTFVCYGADDFDFVNMSLYIDGSLNETNTAGTNATNYSFSKNLNIGTHNWTCAGTDNESQTTTATNWQVTRYNIPEWKEWFNDDLLGFWDMENSSLTDLSGISGDGSSFGTSYFSPGKLGNGLNMNSGTYDAFEIDNVTTTSGTWTFSIWANYTHSDVSGTHYYFWDSYGGGADRENGVVANGKIHTDMDGPDYFYTNDSTLWNDGLMHHFVAVANGPSTSLNLYLDGVSVANYSSVANTDINTNTAIGTSYSGLGNFSGNVDEAFISNRVWNVTDIQSYYNAGFPPEFGEGGNQPPNVTIGIGSLPDGMNLIISPINVTFNCSNVYDASGNLSNVTLMLNGVGVNSTLNPSNNSDHVYIQPLTDGSYSWYCIAYDEENASGQTDTRTFNIDSTSPIVNITNPLNGSLINSYNESIQLNWTALDTNLDTCWYNFDDGSDISISLSSEGNSSSNLFDSNYSSTLVNGNTSYYFSASNQYSLDNQFLNVTLYDVDLTNFSLSSIDSTTQVPLSSCSTTNISVESLCTGTFGPSCISWNNEFTCGAVSLINITTTNSLISTAVRLSEIENYLYANNTVTCALNTTNINYPLDNPDNLTINFFANDTFGHSSLESVIIFRSTTSPTINLTSPPSSFGILQNGDSINLNWTITTNGTLDTCFYEYNYTNTTVNCSLNTSALTFISGVNNLTFYVNDTLGNMNSAFTSWTIALTEYQQFYVNETFEGIINPFWVYVGTNESIVSANLNYNGTNYTGIITELVTDQYNVSYSLLAPGVENETNLSFHWEIELSSGLLATLTSFNQTVLPIELDNCSVYNFTILNLSLFEERSKDPLTGTIEVALNVLDTVDYSIVQELSGLFENVNSTLVCSSMNLSGQDLVYSAEIKYYSDEFVSELYYIQRAIFDGVDSISLFDLNSSYSTEFKATYQDSTFNFVEGAIIQLQRKYISEDIYHVVEAPLTSSEGVAVLHIDLDSNIYRATVVKNGVLLDTFENLVFKCQSELTGECEIKLLGEIDPDNLANYNTERDFIYSDPVLSNGTISVSFTIPSSSSSSVNVILEQKDIFGNETLCNQTIIASAGSISCTYLESLGDSYIDFTIYKDGTPIAKQSYLIKTDSGLDWLDNNFILIVVLLFSLVGMALTSPEWILVNGVLTMVISGGLFLANGLDFVTGLGATAWLVIAVIILISKMSNKEDR